MGAKSSNIQIAKVVIVGDAGVGKTSLLMRFIKNEFDPGYISTIGIAFFSKDIKINGQVICLQIWDTGGQERFGVIRGKYYAGSKGALVVYDKSNPASFTHLMKWIEDIRKGCGNVPIILAGNKADLPLLPTSVTLKQGQEFAKEHNLPFFETSAKTNLNTENVFTLLGKQVFDYLSKS